MLLAVMAILLAARLATAFWHLRAGQVDRFGIMRQFNTNYEANAPTYFSVLLLLFAAVLLGLIAAYKRRVRDRHARHWAVLATLLAIMSADEACQIHEYCGECLSFLKGKLGLLDGIGWVIIGAAVVLVVTVAYLPFLLSLPRKWKMAFCWAGFVYFAFGAIGGEILSALALFFGLHHRFTYAVAETFEEFSEMGGLVILIRGLLTYMEAHEVSVVVKAQQHAPQSAEKPQLLRAARG